jgi:dihydrofolate synthase / folylpolyglutamate synthase
MNYNETIEFLYNHLPAFHRIGKAAYKADLHNTIALDKHLGHPHKRFNSVHVAGTNGKGSVSHIIASVLQEAGYKTGLYTSPHLMDYRERIRVDGKMITEMAVVSFVEQNIDIINKINPSFFEMSVAMAFDYFASCGVDVAVVEVGLGGRLDSTNIITPVLSIITNIGHDHMDLLGDTLEKVAAEKAGIIKEDIPVIIGEKQDLSDYVFIGKAAKTYSELFFAEDYYRCKLEEPDYTSGLRKFELIQTDKPVVINGRIPLGGDYQAKNLQVVATAIELLRFKFNITEENLINGINRTMINTGLQGRWQVLGVNPSIVCDTGHNQEGLKYVIQQLGNTPGDNLHIVIGFVSDKNISSLLPLMPKDAKYYFTRASVPRALDENILLKQGLEHDLKGNSYLNVETAFRAARKNAGKNDIIFIGGSTFIVADFLKYFHSQEPI